jgi:hypothetical protein
MKPEINRVTAIATGRDSIQRTEISVITGDARPTITKLLGSGLYTRVQHLTNDTRTVFTCTDGRWVMNSSPAFMFLRSNHGPTVYDFYVLEYSVYTAPDGREFYQLLLSDTDRSLVLYIKHPDGRENFHQHVRQDRIEIISFEAIEQILDFVTVIKNGFVPGYVINRHGAPIYPGTF